MRQNKNT